MKNTILRNTIRMLLSVSVATIVTGCSTMQEITPQARAGYRMPLTTRGDNLELARNAYRLGNYGLAIEYLENELAHHPTSIAALNGLGASYDGLGRYDVARRYYFRALSIEPASSMTLANIGYSYLLQNRVEDAVRVLELSLRYDPTNSLGARHLATAYAASLASSVPVAEDTFSDVQDVVIDADASTSPLQMMPADIFVDIEKAPAQPVVEQVSVAPSSVDPLPASELSVEVANGNGVAGMARATARWLEGKSFSVTHITNAEHFDYPKTTVYHRPESPIVMNAIAATLPVSAEFHATEALRSDTDVRIVLGHDFAASANIANGQLTLQGAEPAALDSELRIEVSNGNGRTGMARRVSDYFAAQGGRMVRLTNAEHFAFEETVLFYRTGYLDAAEALAHRLPLPAVSLQESASLASWVDAKLVIGHDLLPFDERITRGERLATR